MSAICTSRLGKPAPAALSTAATVPGAVPGADDGATTGSGSTGSGSTGSGTGTGSGSGTGAGSGTVATLPGSSPTVPTRTPTGDPKASGVAPLVGYGLTRAEWDATHERTDSDEPGTYGPVVGGVVAQYLVTCCDDRVTEYLLVLPSGTSLDAAQRRIAREMPSDATRSSVRQLKGCVAQTWASPAIASAVDPAGVTVLYYLPDGEGRLPYASLSVNKPGTAPTC